MLAGMPHEPAGITVTLAFAITRNFYSAFLTPEVYHQLPLMRFFSAFVPNVKIPRAANGWTIQ
jgi:hypothetical protein